DGAGSARGGLMEGRCMTARRHVARLIRPSVVIGTLVWLAVVPSCRRLWGQVGHEPSQSPYHDIRRGGVGVITFGYLGGSPGGPGGYDFGTKLTVGPGAGLRWYPARRLSVRTDFRLVLWRLKYPLGYKQPSPDGSRVLSLDAPLTEWTAHPWITIGLGWTF